ncbi:DUF302 domain-containing protein [Alteromonas sp. 5E99-2]|uniref:DUF302 domain-containing protein n=1 Tax=Alteromonas sp. 5E99-2 TaxID=2817683 RepID=UPI001A98E0F5|nr:DUF302 domain-containing protein [Alteromonas sp. 5E99-2]MBO1254705.1 DUF302 domain-containing protein [Alteromonas sp. 5E99-2]
MFILFRKAFLLCFLFTGFTYAEPEGMVSVPSIHSVSGTADKLESALINKGMTVFARINHAEGAKNVGVALRPTELVLFGNPKVGSPVMACAQSAAIDLPQKMLIWEDESGGVWLSYNDITYVQSRHDIKGCEAVLKKIAGALNNFAVAASK